MDMVELPRRSWVDIAAWARPRGARCSQGARVVIEGKVELAQAVA